MVICSKMHKPYIIYYYTLRTHIYGTGITHVCLRLLTREQWPSCAARPPGGCARSRGRHAAARLRSTAPATTFLDRLRDKHFGTRKIVTNLGRQLLRNESGAPKKQFSILGGQAKCLAPFRDGGGGAKGGEWSSTHGPVRSEERRDEAKERNN